MKKIIDQIDELKKKHDAVILAHNYQLPEVQDIADFCGDSLELSRIAAKTKAKIIVFCGVHFMAETASILCPDKKVIVPDETAGCPMADMITAQQLHNLKVKYSKAIVVGYVNTSAEVKAELDVCCTSGNALNVIKSLPEDKEIIFVPDKYLGDYVSRTVKRKMILWQGYCPTHAKILQEDILKKKKIYPKAIVLAHPECSKSVLDVSDAVLSTSQMLKYVKESAAREFIIATEIGILHKLKKDNPDKIFYSAGELAICPNMKKNTLEKILWCLQKLGPEVCVPDGIRAKAVSAIDKMIAIG